MAWVDQRLLEIRTLITEDWKIEDDVRMEQVCSLYVQARLDHARDTNEAPYGKELKTRFVGEFARMLSEARAFESADLLRDQVTNQLFVSHLPATSIVEAAPALSERKQATPPLTQMR